MSQYHPGLQIVLEREAAIADARILHRRIREFSFSPRIWEIEQEISKLESELEELEAKISRNHWQLECLRAEFSAIQRAFALVPSPGQLSLFETEAG